MKYIVMAEDRGTIFSTTRSATHRTRAAAQKVADKFNRALMGTRRVNVEERPDEYEPAKCDIFLIARRVATR